MRSQAQALPLAHRHRIAPWRRQIFRRIAASGHAAVLVTLQDLFTDGLLTLATVSSQPSSLGLMLHSGKTTLPSVQLDSCPAVQLSSSTKSPTAKKARAF